MALVDHLGKVIRIDRHDRENALASLKSQLGSLSVEVDGTDGECERLRPQRLCSRPLRRNAGPVPNAK